jgi:hypothetical protein
MIVGQSVTASSVFTVVGKWACMAGDGVPTWVGDGVIDTFVLLAIDSSSYLPPLCCCRTTNTPSQCGVDTDERQRKQPCLALCGEIPQRSVSYNLLPSSVLRFWRLPSRASYLMSSRTHDRYLVVIAIYKDKMLPSDILP